MYTDSTEIKAALSRILSIIFISILLTLLYCSDSSLNSSKVYVGSPTLRLAVPFAISLKILLYPSKVSAINISRN